MPAGARADDQAQMPQQPQMVRCGRLAAAQMFAAAKASSPRLLDAIAVGNFAPLLAWLRTNVHEKASSATTDQLLATATGTPLSVAAFKTHLGARYLAPTG